ncbi:hypothetical protein [Isoptericola sp. NPDC057559]
MNTSASCHLSARTIAAHRDDKTAAEADTVDTVRALAAVVGRSAG